jgi:hypothetical protein
MKKRLLLAVLFAVFVVNGAIAGSGSLLGDWEGTARAILPEELPGDGTAIITGITLEGTFVELEKGLFRGEFTFDVPGIGLQEAYATGYIKAQKIQGVMSIDPGGGPVGIGLFEANLKGKKMTGVVRDLSDGSTTIFTAKKVKNSK